MIFFRRERRNRVKLEVKFGRLGERVIVCKRNENGIMRTKASECSGMYSNRQTPPINLWLVERVSCFSTDCSWVSACEYGSKQRNRMRQVRHDSGGELLFHYVKTKKWKNWGNEPEINNGHNAFSFFFLLLQLQCGTWLIEVGKRER